MKIENADHQDKETWDEFVSKYYPPVGGFMQSWKWGLFRERLDKSVNRYFVMDNGSIVAVFTLTKHSLPLGLQYGYAARGPVLADSHKENLVEVCEAIRAWALRELKELIFIRLEPPVSELPSGIVARGFHIPSYYIQPRYNLSVLLDVPEEEILLSLHPTTRSNIRRAEKRGVSVDIRSDIAPNEYEHFKSMMKDTIQRNGGKNAYPNDAYFEALFSVFSESAELGAFYGHQYGEPAATHFVLFFGSTATYLYGAAYTKHLSSKVTTYLHWVAIQEAKRRGMKYYDLGGIDDKRWLTLTEFKRQFRGKEFSYIGNINIPIRRFAYQAYNFLRRIKK